MVQHNFDNLFLTKDNVFPNVKGQRLAKAQIKSALLVDRHLVLIGPPGVGKTTLAKDIAALIPKKQDKQDKQEANFVRIQGSPDLTAEDLFGDIDPMKALKFGPTSIEAFTPGKIFKAHGGMLFFDEINRCPEKIQNALLQVLEEGKATVGGYTIDLPADFIFIGTMNPEDSSTEKLSEVFMDRFDLIQISYPETLDIEREIVLESGKQLPIEFPPKLLLLLIHFIRELRQNVDIERKPSVRATLGLYERAQANAFLKKKKAVDFSDLKEAITSVLSHRIGLKPSLKYVKTPEQFIKESFAQFAEEHGVEEGGDVP